MSRLQIGTIFGNFGNKAPKPVYRFAFIVLPLLLISSQKLAGQVDSTNIQVFSGIIIDDSLGYPLPSVHIWNESTRMGSVSNASGEFKIKAKEQDTLVFSAMGFYSQVIPASSTLNEGAVVRLKQKKYEIDELVVRRFHSYESFIYQVVHHELPESEISGMKGHMDITLTHAAVEADRERVIEEKFETGRFGYITPLGKGINKEKAFREKMSDLEKRKRLIHAKFNRELVGDITKLEGDELSEFIAFCSFTEDYIYKTDLYTIIEALYAKLDDYHSDSARER